MRWKSSVVLLAMLVVPAAALAQHGAPGSARSAPPEAAQFDFLVGQWELVAQPRASGLAARLHGVPKLLGTWKAWRALDGWGIEDEMRLSDQSGNPRALAHTVRVYSAPDKRWNSSTLDVYAAAFTAATAEWRGGQMHLTSRGTDQQGRAYVSRTRFYAITATSFRFQQDRSYDGGRTWTDALLKIEAKRVSATAAR